MERITQKAEIQWTEAVSDGPVPELHTDSEEEEPKEAEEPIKPGDHIFEIGLVPVPAEIRATSSVSQRLAEAFKRNSEASAPSGQPVPEYLKEFDSIFSKESSDAVRGRSTSSDVSSDISPSPLYIPPHRRQPKTECTRGSDTGVR